MKRNFVVVLAIAAVTVLMAGALVACGGSSGASGSAASGSAAEPAAELTEFDFYSVAIPEGFEASDAKNVFKATEGNGSFYVAVLNSSADELLEIELNDSDFKQGDDFVAGDKTYKVATSDKWGITYYIIDWEDGSFEVKASNVDDEAAIESFLGSLQPAEDAYAKWQAAS